MLRKGKIESDLLFITTISAFGKSSIYDRLRYYDEVVAELLRNTRGYGSFHFPEDVYEEVLQFPKSKGEKIARGYGNGPSKMRLISHGLYRLGFNKSFTYHGVRREFYLFPLVRNLREVIRGHQSPKL